MGLGHSLVNRCSQEMTEAGEVFGGIIRSRHLSLLQPFDDQTGKMGG